MKTAPDPFSLFKLNITANNGDSITQLQELQLLAIPAS